MAKQSVFWHNSAYLFMLLVWLVERERERERERYCDRDRDLFLFWSLLLGLCLWILISACSRLRLRRRLLSRLRYLWRSGYFFSRSLTYVFLMCKDWSRLSCLCCFSLSFPSRSIGGAAWCRFASGLSCFFAFPSQLSFLLLNTIPFTVFLSAISSHLKRFACWCCCSSIEGAIGDLGSPSLGGCLRLKQISSFLRNRT